MDCDIESLYFDSWPCFVAVELHYHLLDFQTLLFHIYLTMLTKVKNNSRIRQVIWICFETEWLPLWPMLHPSTKFHENLARNVSMILLTNR